MRKASLIIALLFLGVLVGPVLAQVAELPDPGLTPDSPFYFLERISEGIGTFFTFGNLKKAERYTTLAAERIAEAKAVVEKGKPEAAKIALKRYNDQLEKALNEAEKAKAKGENIEKVTETLARATSKHLTVLERVLEKVPEVAKGAITRALEKSKDGHIKALKALAGENPTKAVKINIDSAQGRLEKAKKEAAKKSKEKVKDALEDYENFQTVLERIRGKGKTLAVLVSEERIKDIKDLDEIEDGAEDISTETKGQVKKVKDWTIDKQNSSLRDVADEDPERATEINLEAAEARLNRARLKAEEDDVEEAEDAVKEFENQYKFGEEISEIAKGLGKDTTTIEQLVGKATSIHLEILADVYKKVPEKAKEAIENAMSVSVKGHEKAVKILKEKNALGEIPEEPPMPEKVPKEIQGKIERKVKEEIEKEELKEETEKPELKEEIKEKPELEEEETEKPEVEEPEIERPEMPSGPTLPRPR